MEKLILVFYLDIRYIDNADISTYAKEIFESLNPLKEDNLYIIPILGETRLECINPKLITEDEYEEVKRKLEKINNKYKELYGNKTTN